MVAKPPPDIVKIIIMAAQKYINHTMEGVTVTCWAVTGIERYKSISITKKHQSIIKIFCTITT